MGPVVHMIVSIHPNRKNPEFFLSRSGLLATNLWGKSSSLLIWWHRPCIIVGAGFAREDKMGVGVPR